MSLDCVGRGPAYPLTTTAKQMRQAARRPHSRESRARPPLSVSTDPRRGLVHWQFGFIILLFAGKAPEFRIPAQDSSLRMIPKLDKTCVCVLPQIRQLSSRGQLNRGKIVKFTENQTRLMH